MSKFVDKISSYGSITDFSDVSGAMPNAKVYDGSTVWDRVMNYQCMEWTEPRTILTMFKHIGTQLLVPTVYSTRTRSTNVLPPPGGVNGSNGSGEEVASVPIAGRTYYGMRDSIFGVTAGVSNVVRFQNTMVSAKWNTIAFTKDGSGSPAAGMAGYLEGARIAEIQSTGAAGQLVNSIIPLDDWAWIGRRWNPFGSGLPEEDIAASNNIFKGEIAIFTIYKGILSNNDLIRFKIDPFAFNNSLDSADCHLRIDFNRTAGQDLIDTGSGAYTIVSTGAKNFTTIS